MTCSHSEFTASVEVSLISSEGGAVDLKVHCSSCGAPVEFVGMPLGVSASQPTISADGTEARLPIKVRRLETQH